MKIKYKLLPKRKKTNFLIKKQKKLVKYSKRRAKELVKKFSHTRPNGKQGAFCLREKYGVSSGENLAKGFIKTKKVVNAWMNSETHKKVLLGTKYRFIGTACWYKNGIYYWTMHVTAKFK